MTSVWNQSKIVKCNICFILLDLFLCSSAMASESSNLRVEYIGTKKCLQN